MTRKRRAMWYRKARFRQRDERDRNRWTQRDGDSIPGCVWSDDKQRGNDKSFWHSGCGSTVTVDSQWLRRHLNPDWSIFFTRIYSHNYSISLLAGEVCDYHSKKMVHKVYNAQFCCHSHTCVGMGIVWVFSDTGAKPVLLKRYRCLNGAWTDTLKKRSRKTTIDNDDIKNLFSHIPWKSRSHCRTDKKRRSDCRGRCS